MMLTQLLVAILIIAVIFYVLRMIPLDPPWKNIAYVVVGVIVIIYLLRLLGVSMPI
jgi:hypothetical protein